MPYNRLTMKYHRQAYGLPKFEPFQFAELTYSLHARHRSAEKSINLPKSLNSRDCTVFEIEVTDVRKFALRTHYNQTFDLCMAVDVNGFVRTVWLNRKNDRHATLNKKLYDRP